MNEGKTELLYVIVFRHLAHSVFAQTFTQASELLQFRVFLFKTDAESLPTLMSYTYFEPLFKKPVGIHLNHKACTCCTHEYATLRRFVCWLVA